MPEIRPLTPLPSIESLEPARDNLDLDLEGKDPTLVEQNEKTAPTEPSIEARNEPETAVAQEAQERKEGEKSEEQTNKQEKKFVGIKEFKRQRILRKGIKPLYNLAESDEFSDEEILSHLSPWIEKYAAKPENVSEMLKYFELAKEIISSEFPPDRRVEVICALAEILAEGHMDAETLTLLVSKIEPEKQDTSREDQSSGYKGIAFFPEASDERGARITLAENFFEQDETGARKYNLSHMLKHEVGHGLISYGEVLSYEEMAAINSQIKDREARRQAETPKISAEIYRILAQAENDQHLQTYHLATVLKSYEAFKQQEGVTETQIQQRAVMAANQIMAEKVGLYLSSNGEFADFLRANIEVTSDENLRNIFGTTEKPEIQTVIAKVVESEGEERETNIAELRQQCPELMRFIESNKVFFDLASKRLANKDKLKENIKKNIAKGQELGQEEEDFFGYYDGGFYEPGTPANNQSSQSKGQRDDFWSTAIELAGAIGKEVEEVTPVTELTKSKAT